LLAEQFGVNKTQIQQTIKHKVEYMMTFEDNTASSHKRPCICLNGDELEGTVWSWFKTAHSKKISVSGPMIQEEARKVADGYLWQISKHPLVGWISGEHNTVLFVHQPSKTAEVNTHKSLSLHSIHHMIPIIWIKQNLCYPWQISQSKVKVVLKAKCLSVSVC